VIVVDLADAPPQQLLEEEKTLSPDRAGMISDRRASGPGRPTQALTVNRQCARTACGVGAAVGESAAHGLVQGVAVDPGQQTAGRRFRRPESFGKQRMPPRADGLQYLGRGVGDPPVAVPARDPAPASTTHAVSASTTTRAFRTPRGSRGSGSLAAGPAGPALSRGGPWTIAELVKGGWDRRRYVSRHDLPLGSRGAENFMILGVRACLVPG
jgi:hypothetical protein